MINIAAFQQVAAPLGSLALSALVALLPLVTIFVLLGVLKHMVLAFGRLVPPGQRLSRRRFYDFDMVAIASHGLSRPARSNT